jgi:hypothetical protein
MLSYLFRDQGKRQEKNESSQNNLFTWIINYFKTNTRHLFLLDAIGAFFTACSLCLIKFNFADRIGMSKDILLCLCVIALLYALYSLSCYLFDPTKWKYFLRVIIFANIIYCFSIVALIIIYSCQLKVLGWIYFLVEAFVILALVSVEYKIVKLQK